jgi:DNA-binding HxlR family transcriptional regulator
MQTSTDVRCVQAATTILGDKWTPLLLRYFLNEPVVRFCRIQDEVGGINPRTLSARLTRLEAEGVIYKLDPDATRCSYSLTEKGKALLPILHDMEIWSTQYGK